jgi:1-acyl-sn-glycerol-3-phosphate acyltransferase
VSLTRDASERTLSSRLQQVGFACLRAAVVAGAAVALAEIPSLGAIDFDAVRRTDLLTGLGAAIGCAAAGFQIHPRRSLGLVAPAATGLFLILLAAAIFGASWSWPFCLTLGLFVGIAGPAWRAVTRIVAASLPAAALDAGFAVLTLLPFALIENGVLAPPDWWYGVLAAAFGFVAVVAWSLFAVPTLELFIEFLFWPMYDVRVHGPGADRIPHRGPVLIIANHSTYADPFFLSKIAPRKVTPMMTSVFYDLPVIRWLMVHAVGAIRVQKGAFRREAPELRDAVARLRGGGCVLLFPEGFLRRKEESILMPFGQGFWHILRELPQTPVVVCWIEGGWGSFASYRGGPPMKHKALDWRRRIDIAVAEPRVLDAAVLADHRTTRAALRQACLECRGWLGLPIPVEGKNEETLDEPAREEAEGR